MVQGMRFLAVAVCALAASAQTPGRPTDQPRADEVAALKTGPALPYKVAAGWPDLPKGYNFGEASGVDVDKDRNVWVFNRGHWPVIKLDRTGKMLEAWSEDTLKVRSSHGLRVAPDGNIWCAATFANSLVRLTPSGTITEFFIPTGTSEPTDLTFAPDGRLWFAEMAGNTVGVFAP